MDLGTAAEQIRQLAVEYRRPIEFLALGSLAFFLFTPVLAPAAIILMPADALTGKRKHFRDRPILSAAGHLLLRIFRHLLGIALILIGFILLFIPGQGLLTIFVGLLLTDLPGKRQLLSRLLGSGKIRPAVDRLRARFKREEMCWPDDRNLHN